MARKRNSDKVEQLFDIVVNGPIGLTAIVRASSKEDAIAKLRKHLPTEIAIEVDSDAKEVGVLAMEVKATPSILSVIHATTAKNQNPPEDEDDEEDEEDEDEEDEDEADEDEADEDEDEDEDDDDEDEDEDEDDHK